MGILISAEVEDLAETYDVEVGALEFLTYNHDLVPFLHELAPVLREYFPNAPLRLHLERDPETGRELELWALAVWTRDSGQWMQAQQKLEAFDKNWWDEKARLHRHRLAVDFVFAGDAP